MKKRVLAMMLTAALAVGMLSGCGSGNTENDSQKTAG